MTTSAPLLAERARLAALRRYAVLDTPREDSFDRLVRLAARVMDMPIAAIGLVDADRVWFKAQIGLNATEVPRRLAMCSRTVGSETAYYELPDASADPALAGNPLLAPPVGIGFYAGAALTTPDGHRIGALCVIDRRARPPLTAEQHATLADLAATVMTELERRRQQALREAASARLALIDDVLTHAGGATGFVPAIEAAIARLCRHTGAIDGQVWAKGAGHAPRALAFATDGDAPADRRAAFFRLFADRSRARNRAVVPPEGRVVMVPEITAERAAKRPLLRDGYERGMRSFLAQSLTVGGERFGLVLNFGTPRTDLPEVAELLAEIGRAIRPALQRKQAEERLASLQASLQDRTADLTELARLARIGAWSWRAEDNRVEWSDETYGLFGVARDSFKPTVAGCLRLLHPQDIARACATGRHAIRHGHDLQAEVRVPIAGARTRSIVWNATARRGPKGTAVELRGYCQDVTDRREAEAALRHGEKLRALGKLTGGIAHEFNNLLTVVQANLELALDPATNLADARPELEAAQRAVIAGTELTARLLSVARSEPLRREATDLAALLRPLQEMATRTLGSRYQLALTTCPDLPPVSVDRSQLEGAVLNLILNARDAMALGGPIAIRTARLSVPPGARGALADLAPGQYAEIAVRDRGTGMAPDVAEHAFEPFFTTKSAGSGTGLGLSMVLGFARQSGGIALIDTTPGVGTTVRIVLPLA